MSEASADMNALTPCRVVLSLGSNYLQEQYFCQAFAALTEAFGELMFSPVYESQAVNSASLKDGNEGSGDYYNVVVSFDSDQSVAAIQTIIRDIESSCDRDRSQSVVTIDIDFLLYGDAVGVQDGVMFPRAEILHCAYVLRPLADIFPNSVHPVTQQSFSALWHSFCESKKQASGLDPIDFVWREQVISIAPPCLMM